MRTNFVAVLVGGILLWAGSVDAVFAVKPPSISIDLTDATDSGISSTDNVTMNSWIRLRGRGPSGATLAILDNGRKVLELVTATDGSWEAGLGLGDDGRHALVAEAREGKSPTLLVTLDTEKPAPPTIGMSGRSDTGLSDKDGITRDSTPVLTGTTDRDTAEIMLGDSVYYPRSYGRIDIRGGKPGKWEVKLRERRDGDYLLRATAVDLAGNISRPSAAFKFTVDTRPPPRGYVAFERGDDQQSPHDRVFYHQDIRLRFSGGDITYILDRGKRIATIDFRGGGHVSPMLRLKPGIHDLTAYGMDVAGNVGEKSVPSRAIVARTPTIARLSAMTEDDGWELRGAAQADEAGWSVSAAGDVNGDGFDDFIVGAPYSDGSGGRNVGAVYVIFGGEDNLVPSGALPGLDGSHGFRFEGQFADEAIGLSVAAGGDINADGFADIIAVGTEVAYVILGHNGSFPAVLTASELDGTNGFRVVGKGQKIEIVNGSASGIGDVNGDGIDDFAVTSGRFIDSGRDPKLSLVNVFFGKEGDYPAVLHLEDMESGQGFRLKGTASDGLGKSIAGPVDVNRDGVGDLLVGAPSTRVKARRAGAVYVIYGRKSGAFPLELSVASMRPTDGVRVEAGPTSNEFGLNVSAADFNGDKIPDIGVQVDERDTVGYVLLGRQSGFDPVERVNGTANKDVLAIHLRQCDLNNKTSQMRMALIPDTNGDGKDDLLAGWWLGTLGCGVPDGKTYLLYGAGSSSLEEGRLELMTKTQGMRFDGAKREGSGRAVAGAGDVNGDGIGDMIIGAPFWGSAGNKRVGAAYLVFGVGKQVQSSRAASAGD